MLTRKLYYLKRLLSQQWKSSEDLKKIQMKMLRFILIHTYKYVPFYKKKWKQYKVKPDDIKNIEDLKKIPIITRKEIIRNYTQFISLNYKYQYEVGDVITKFTSGSSGSPLKMIFDSRSWDYLEAVYLRALLAVNYNPRKKLVYYWYEPFERKIYDRLGFMNKIYIPCHISEDEQINILQKINPEYLYYFSSIIYSISKKMKHLGIFLNSKFVMTHGEILSNVMRKIIQNTFDCPVYNAYGSTEFNRMAWNCKQNAGYHVDMDSIVLEVIKSGEEVSSGEKGFAIVTGLTNFLLPLIRYKIGDIVTPIDDLCTCGRKLPLIKSIEGRYEDMIILKSGKVFIPQKIIDSIADIPEIYKFRVSYIDRNRFLVNLVLLRQTNKTLDNIEEKLKKLFQEDVKIKFNIVDEIPKSDRGKRKLIGS
jgi:phenylacetate-CoA ligase